MKRTRPRLLIVAAIIAALTLTATTALAVTFGWHDKLIEYLNPSEEQMETLSGAVNTPDISVTKDGVTLTVKQTLADSFGIYVLYELEVPDTIELSEELSINHFLSVPLTPSVEGYTFGVGGSKILEMSEHKATVLIHASWTEPLENGQLRLALMGVTHYYNNGPEDYGSIPILEGEWELEWDFSYVDTSRIVEPNAPLTLYDAETVIKKVAVSPISVCVFVEGDDILGGARPTVNFRDGSQITYKSEDENASFMYYLSNEAKMISTNCLYYRFENIINLDDVVSVTLGDVTIPIG